MKPKDNWLDMVLIGTTVILAVSLILSASKKKSQMEIPPVHEDPFDTTELNSSYHFMHSEIKK
jgi:hypothetical protein